MNVLVTGGAGYIGSHTCVELLNVGHTITVIDNLANAKEESLHRVQELTGKLLFFHQVDLLDKEALSGLFADNEFDAVIHFAALKAVGESVANPLAYYDNNVTGTLYLLEAMQAHGVKRLVFSSSATVYGVTETMPLIEDAPLGATNPYGWSKFMMEQILRDLHIADPEWRVALLRYFNPVGAHPSGRIGEDPNGIPNNLFPYITQVAVGKREKLQVYGGDYPTPDGTGVRDYIHVMDLATGHLKALDRLNSAPGLEAYNLGTGRGYSVLEVIAAFEEAADRPIPYEVVERRPGDVAISFANSSKAAKELGWVADKDIASMCRDAWHWQSQNPEGY